VAVVVLGMLQRRMQSQRVVAEAEVGVLPLRLLLQRRMQSRRVVGVVGAEVLGLLQRRMQSLRVEGVLWLLRRRMQSPRVVVVAEAEDMLCQRMMIDSLGARSAASPRLDAQDAEIRVMLLGPAVQMPMSMRDSSPHVFCLRHICGRLCDQSLLQ